MTLKDERERAPFLRGEGENSYLGEKSFSFVNNMYISKFLRVYIYTQISVKLEKIKGSVHIININYHSHSLYLPK